MRESRIPRILEQAAKRTNGGSAGMNVQSWYLAKKELALPVRYMSTI